MSTSTDVWKFLTNHGFTIMDPAECGGEQITPLKIPRRSKNVRIATKSGRSMLLYVKMNHYGDTVWNVNANIIELLVKQELAWALVLLSGDCSHGFWFTASDARAASERVWSFRGGKYDYKITEPDDLANAIRFESSDEFFSLIEGSLKESVRV